MGCVGKVAYDPYHPLLQEVYLTRDHLCVVMELAEGGDLAQRMEELHHYGVRTPCFACIQVQSCMTEASASGAFAARHAVDELELPLVFWMSMAGFRQCQYLSCITGVIFSSQSGRHAVCRMQSTLIAARFERLVVADQVFYCATAAGSCHA